MDGTAEEQSVWYNDEPYELEIIASFLAALFVACMLAWYAGVRGLTAVTALGLGLLGICVGVCATLWILSDREQKSGEVIRWAMFDAIPGPPNREAGAGGPTSGSSAADGTEAPTGRTPTSGIRS